MTFIIEDEETVIIEGKELERLVDWKVSELDDVFEEEEFVDSIDLHEETDEKGELYFLIQIYDMSLSMTTIRCDKKGYKIHFGSSTPWQIKTAIEKVMNDE